MTTRVLVVDWLGRGGIAQTAAAWARELGEAGAEVRVVTRGGRELDASGLDVVSPSPGGLHLLAHARVVRCAIGQVRSWRPDVVVVQSYVVPSMEVPLHHSVRASGARLVLVLHNHRHHAMAAGTDLGLGRLVRGASDVVVHSEEVRRGVRLRPVHLVPHPVPVSMLDDQGVSPFADLDDELVALHFGVLHRAYKGTSTVVRMVEEVGTGSWTVALAGVGAPVVDGARSVDRFLGAGELVAAVRQAGAVLLPYERATQSGAVVLAHLCRAVPVVADVGGLSEQVVHGENGLLLPPGSAPRAWADALEALADPAVRTTMADAGESDVWARHDTFRSEVRRIVGLPSAVRASR